MDEVEKQLAEAIALAATVSGNDDKRWIQWTIGGGAVVAGMLLLLLMYYLRRAPDS